MRKVILTDVDGVLLDWIGAFDEWMHEHHNMHVAEGGRDAWDVALRYGNHQLDGTKIVKQFNESAAIGFLSPFQDSVKYVRKLHEEHGYIFRAITSVGDNRYTKILRQQNLERVFGKDIFDELICLPMMDNKQKALELYKDSGYWWIEDHVSHAELGQELGLNSIIMRRIYNQMQADRSRLVKANNWRDIYEIIVGK